METLTGREVAEFIVIVLEVTGFGPVMHVALEVSMHDTRSPFAGEYV